MTKLRLGIIGAGAWAVASHLPNLARYRDQVDFVVVNRLGESALEQVKQEFGFARATQNYHEALQHELDICVVAGPAALHYEHARAALEAGAHVLVEKPFTLDVDHAWHLVDTARRLRRHLLVAYGWNYKAMVEQARELMWQDGGIGEIEHLMIHMASATRELLSEVGSANGGEIPSVPEARTWTDPRLSGGGYAQAQLTHALGLALWLTNLRGREVFAMMAGPSESGVELHAAATIRYENGAIGTMSGGSNHAGAGGNKHQLQVRMIGSDGQFDIDLERELVWRYRGPDDDIKLDLEPGAGAYDCVGPVDALVDLALGRQVENCSPIELGARTVEILDAAYRSALSGKVEEVRSAVVSTEP